MASGARRSGTGLGLFFTAWVLGPGALYGAGFLANPWHGRIWTPDASPYTIEGLEHVVSVASFVSLALTLVLCVRRGGPSRLPECWLLLLSWVAVAMLFATNCGVFMQIYWVAATLSFGVGIFRLIRARRSDA
jgi:hypothetical protein